jgi:hypothetical protein
MAELTSIRAIVNKTLGEQNLYKIDRWKYPYKKCRHNNEVFCEFCRKEIEKELSK